MRPFSLSPIPRFLCAALFALLPSCSPLLAADPPSNSVYRVGRIGKLPQYDHFVIDDPITFKNPADRAAFALELALPSAGLSADVNTLLGAANFAGMRTDLGLVIGTDVQAYNAKLAAIAGNTGSLDISGTTLTIPASTSFGGSAVSIAIPLSVSGSGSLSLHSAGTVSVTFQSGTMQTTTGAADLNTVVTAGGSARELGTIVLEQMPTPFDYGAVGGGVTDDYTALQAALTSGKSIYFPAGKVFRSSHSLAMSSTTGQIIQGAGQYLSRIVFDSGIDGVYPGGPSQSIRDIGLIGTGSNATGVILGGPGGGYSNNFQGSRVYLQYWDTAFSNENGWDGSGLVNSKADMCNRGVYSSGNQDRFDVDHCNITNGITLNGATGCDTTSGSAVVACTNTTGVVDGRYISGNGIPAGTTIVSHVTNTSLTLSANATQTITGNSLTQVYGIGVESNGSGAVVIKAGVFGGLVTPFKLTSGGNLHASDVHAELSDGLGVFKGGNNAVVEAENNYMADPPNTTYVHASFATGTRAVFTHNTAHNGDFSVAYSGTCDIRSPDFSAVVRANSDHYFRAGPWLTVDNSATAGADFWPAAAETALGMIVVQVYDHAQSTREKVWQCFRTASNTFAWQLINGTAVQYNVGTGANNIVQLDGSSRLPAVDGSQLTGIVSGGVGQTYVASLSAHLNNLGGTGTTLTGVSDLTINPSGGVPIGKYAVTFVGSVAEGGGDGGFKWDLNGGTAVFATPPGNSGYQRTLGWRGSNFYLEHVTTGTDGAITGYLQDGETWADGVINGAVAMRYEGMIEVTTAGSVVVRIAHNSGSPGGGDLLAYTRIVLIKQ